MEHYQIEFTKLSAEVSADEFEALFEQKFCRSFLCPVAGLARWIVQVRNFSG